ncbi:MAG: alanine:cation symporter family protein, partial [Fulvivirga sp.]
EDKKYVYNYVYVATIIFGSVASLSTIFSLIDGAFALMAIPTMTSALILAPKVIKAADEYIAKMKSKNVLD